MKDINLIPEQYVVQQTALRHAIGWGIVLAGLLVAVAAGALWQHQRLAASRRAVADGASAAKAVDQLREQLRSFAIERTAMEAQLDRVGSLLARKYRSGLLAHVAGCVNDDIVLTSLRLEPPPSEAPPAPPPSSRATPPTPEPSAPRPTATGPALLIRGYTLSDLELARFISSLRQSEQIEGVRLEYSQQAEGPLAGLKSFELRCTITHKGSSDEPSQG